MNTFNKLQAKAVSNIAHKLARNEANGKKGLADKPLNPKDILKELAGMIDDMPKLTIKVDKGTSLTARDKQTRKALPKAKNEAGRRNDSKAATLSRILDIIERVQKMAPKELDLHSQLWVAYAKCEALHVDDDHWLIADLPQAMRLHNQLTRDWYIDKAGKVQRRADERPLLEQMSVSITDCNSTKGGEHYKMDVGSWEAGSEYKQSEARKHG